MDWLPFIRIDLCEFKLVGSMGKQRGKKKKQVGETSSDASPKHSKLGDKSSEGYDKDTTVFIAMSQELRSGTSCFMKETMKELC